MAQKKIKGTHIVMVIVGLVLLALGATIYLEDARERLRAATATMPKSEANVPRTRDSLRRVPKQLQPPTKRTAK